MADTPTPFDGFTRVTTLNPTDLLLGLRGAGGVNVNIADLFRSVPDYIQTGWGVSTGPCGIEIGDARTGDGLSHIDFHSTVGTDYDARIIRGGSANGSMEFRNTGIGDMNFVQEGGGRFLWYQSSAINMYFAGGTLFVGQAPPSPACRISALDGIQAANSGVGSPIFQTFNTNAPSGSRYTRFYGDNSGNFIVERINDNYTSALALFVCSTSAFYSGADNSFQLGASGNRWSVVFSATGTINTSDEREKAWRGGATDAEINAARQIISELGFYQWNEAVAEKGDDARLHFGVRAQRVWGIMADAGLIAPVGKDGKPGKTPYAFLCWDEWPDEYEDEVKPKKVRRRVTKTSPASGVLRPDGQPAQKERMGYETVEEMVPTGKKVLKRPAGDRFGVRVDQLTLFLIAAQEARIAALEAA